jgi:hypothetical protein
LTPNLGRKSRLSTTTLNHPDSLMTRVAVCDS